MKKVIAGLVAATLCLMLCGCCLSHNFVPATCITPATCTKCGKTEGEPLGHDWAEATCTNPKKCTTCGATEGEPLGHDWAEATCTNPKKCTTCGATEGKPLGHDWKDATCEEPRTCLVCGATEGEALGHTVESWKVTVKSTCSTEGTESGTCLVCGAEVCQAVPMVEHKIGDWEVLIMPTKTTEGTRVKTCKVCGFEAEREQFKLTEEELRQLYISNCKSIPYDKLSRTPDEYQGEYIKFSGKVVQVCNEAKSATEYSTYRLATSGGYRNVVYIKVNNFGSGSRILEDDVITVYGEFDGLYTYTTVRGDQLTIPQMIVEYYK